MIQVTEAEWKIMEVLWDAHPRTMADITKALLADTGWTRHTVITLLKRMQEKGAVAVDESGEVKRYSPLITREEATTDERRKLTRRIFGGEASMLVSNLVSSGDMSVEELQTLLDRIKGKDSASN